MATPKTLDLSTHFAPFRQHIIGNNTQFSSIYGLQNILYTDWTASGRLYQPIEDKISQQFGQYCANTHTETNYTGTVMTHAYHEARCIIKQHVNATSGDVLIMVGSGMTAAINKWQRILGLRIPEQFYNQVQLTEAQRPIVFITHMEHHSNQTTWLETIADVRVIEPTPEGLVDVNHLTQLLDEYANRPLKIAAITACSNITGIQTPYYQIAELMHRAGGLCFVDFACSAPYVQIDMHPANKWQKLDAIYFSPHKFLGGPGTPGVLIFDASLYKLRTPDQPGGGTVAWTNPWGEHRYFDDIEAREDGGTPPFLQTIKTALAIKLKEAMGINNIIAREHEMVQYFLPRLKQIPGLNVLAGHIEDRLGVVSFYINGLHYNLGVKLLNDRYGIQVRGGCSCAGTYGHYLLGVDPNYSHQITDLIDSGDLSQKPGWIRLSIHPTTTNKELDYCLDAIAALAQNHTEWANDYQYDCHTNEYQPIAKPLDTLEISQWFSFD